MRKAFNLFWLSLCAVVVVGVWSGRIHARLTGTDPGTDIFCVGPSGAEMCVSSTGSLVPTTTNVSSLGTSSLKFKDANLAGNASIGGTMAVTGASTFGAALQPMVQTSYQIARLTPAASGYIIVNTTRKTICISTGTGVGAWVFISTQAADVTADSQCY